MFDSDEPYINPHVFLANIRRIENLTQQHDGTAEIAFIHTMEELTEVARCLRGRHVDEPMHVECLDAINCLVELYFRAGGKLEDFSGLQAKKIDKWERKLGKKGK